MLLRKVALVAAALVMPSVAALHAASDQPSGRMYSAPCMTDTAIRNYVLHGVKAVMDAPSSDSANVAFRAALGLSDVSYSQVTVAQDSATCESARIAYTGIIYPAVADTAARRAYVEFLSEVLVVRLAPNRLLLATDVYNPVSVVEMFVVDSTYSLVRRGF